MSDIRPNNSPGHLQGSYYSELEPFVAADGPWVWKKPSRVRERRRIARYARLYEREVRFYQELAPQVPGVVAACRSAVYISPDEFLLIIADLGPSEISTLAGATFAQYSACLRAVSTVHRVLRDQAPSWLPTFEIDPIVRNIAPLALSVLGQCAAALGVGASETRASAALLLGWRDHWAVLAAASRGVIHGDCKADNVILRNGAARLIDWQLAMVGPLVLDVAMLTVLSLSRAVRRALPTEMIATWTNAAGAPSPTEEVWRAAEVYVLAYAVASAGTGLRDGDVTEENLVMARRAFDVVREFKGLGR